MEQVRVVVQIAHQTGRLFVDHSLRDRVVPYQELEASCLSSSQRSLFFFCYTEIFSFQICLSLLLPSAF